MIGLGTPGAAGHGLEPRRLLLRGLLIQSPSRRRPAGLGDC
jgi:hypothetical protein